MRTTVNIDDDILELAKSLSDAQHVSLGKALSDLARRGLKAPPQMGTSPSGFHTFVVPEGAPTFGPEEVEAALEADDLEYAKYFVKPNPR